MLRLQSQEYQQRSSKISISSANTKVGTHPGFASDRDNAVFVIRISAFLYSLLNIEKLLIRSDSMKSCVVMHHHPEHTELQLNCHFYL